MAYDAADGYVVLFGGAGVYGPWGGAMNDTWIFRQGSWTELHPLSSPSPRYFASMTFDPACACVIMFGGIRPAVDLNETWSFRGGVWTNMTPSLAVSPPREDAYGSIAYDSYDGYVVLYGAGSPVALTWKLVSGTWENITRLPTPPYGADNPPFVDVPPSHGAVLLAGWTQNETWLFSGGSWTNMTGAAPLPEFFGPAVSYDSKLGDVVLYGGRNLSGTASVVSNETWLYSAGQWRHITTQPIPPRIELAVSAFDAQDGYVVQFGGVETILGSFDENETWDFGPPVLARIVADPNPTDVGVPISFQDPYYMLVGSGVVNWTLSGGFSTGTSNFTYTPGIAGSVAATLSVRSGNGIYNNSSLIVLVNPYPSSGFTTAPTATDIGLPVNFTPQVRGGSNPLRFNWSFGDGTYSAQATPTHPYALEGNYSVSLAVVDEAGVLLSSNGTVTIEPLPSAVLRLSSSILDLGQPLSFSTEVTNGTPPYTYFYSALPLGCFSSSVASQSCLPTTTGTFPIVAIVHDSVGARAATSAVTLEVYPTLVVDLHIPSTVVDIGQDFSVQVQVSGGAPGPLRFTYSGLPGGCIGVSSSSTITCLPSMTSVTNLTVMVNDSSPSGVTSSPVRLVVNPDPTLAFSASAAVLQVNALVALNTSTFGGSPPFTFTYTHLPPGCQSENFSTLLCRPNAPGTYNVTINATDSVHVSRFLTITLAVLPASGTGIESSPIFYGTLAMLLAIGGAATVGLVLWLRRRRGRKAEAFQSERE